jgi:3-hydroxybutyryl-CoA dehydrogenase
MGAPPRNAPRNTGVANTVLIDLALDYDKATRMALSTAQQC